MKKNEYLKFPLTGDLIRVVSYSPEDFNAIKEFISENYHEDYTVSIYDSLSGCTLEITNTVKDALNDIIDVVCYISSKEHTFVNWIGINSITKSYVISMDFTRGSISFGFYNIDTKNKKIIMIT